MSRFVRCGSLALVALGPAFLLGCVAKGPATTAAAPAPAGRQQAYSLNTPLDRIAADKRGKAILERDLPGLMASRSYVLFDDMSLSQIAMMSGGRLSQTKLDMVEADLAQLSAPAAAPQ
ncbi:MAG TPA: hypothetical protein VNC39_06585 [Acidocella sp.]|uniref:hypothetical protein n=1 Tax=Acidocella sp. TaxID=50710 RepID=UPI002CEEDED5|nr:hypothetical protein [Acidocella sp.]HVE21625.1 hypothetical protein [Acidocella sp.]